MGSWALSLEVEGKPEAPFLPSHRCLFLGPSRRSLRPLPPPLPAPPNPAPSADWSPACRGAGLEGFDVTGGGGRAARGGGDGPRLSTSESSLPGLVLLRNRRRGREPGGRATRAEAGGWPWRGRCAPAGRGPSGDPAVGGPGRRAG